MTELTPETHTKGGIAIVVAVAAIPMLALIWGMKPGNPYGYFVFLRIVVCFCAFIFTAIFAGQKRETLVVIFAGIAILFNPLLPIYLTREKWLVIDAATIVIFAVGFGYWLAWWRRKSKSNA